MHLMIIGGSDAGISAGLRARELDSTIEVTLVVADEYPNYSICGLKRPGCGGDMSRHGRMVSCRMHVSMIPS